MKLKRGLTQSLLATLTVAMLAAFKAGPLPKARVAWPTFKNWGIMNAQSNSHISAPRAWGIEEGNRNILVAVIDTGIDPTHRDLQANISRNPSKQYGYDFVLNQPNPIDDHGHGTHVAGIIGAVSNPAAGVSGVTHHVSIMAVKYYSDMNSGAVNLKNTVRAIHYAIDHGARIINYSGGGPEYSEEEFQAIKRAEEKGILFVAAAGNESRDTNFRKNYYFPSAYNLSNVLSVAATDINNRLIATSNWGNKHVQVAAPGENIYSTLPGNRYGYMSGTSQATAFVSGVAALLLSQNPKLKPKDLVRIITQSSDSFPQLSGKIQSGGRVNAYKALMALRGIIKPQLASILGFSGPSDL